MLRQFAEVGIAVNRGRIPLYSLLDQRTIIIIMVGLLLPVMLYMYHR